VRRVQDKLTGLDFDNDEALDVAEQVERLILQATSKENLCQLFTGWYVGSACFVLFCFLAEFVDVNLLPVLTPFHTLLHLQVLLLVRPVWGVEDRGVNTISDHSGLSKTVQDNEGRSQIKPKQNEGKNQQASAANCLSLATFFCFLLSI